MIAFLLNVASVCFFLSELFGMVRAYKARDDMDSSSFEGKLSHVFGNWIIVGVAILTGAWVAVVIESFLGCLCIYRTYLKFRWLRKSGEWSWSG